MTSAVIFDMDGTLLRLDVDIEEVRLRLGALFAPYGITGGFRPVLLRVKEAAREAAAGERAGDPAALERAGLEILSRYEVDAARTARARPGAPRVVAGLRAAGAPLGIVTDNGRACVEPALRAAGIDPGAFACVATRDDVPAPKPDPAGVIRVARALRAGPVWYVGDHAKDVAAGRAARAEIPGLRVAALAGGFTPRATLEEAGADAILDDLDQILSLP